FQILPYRAIFSSSGPLSWAFTYEKAVLISDILQPYLETNDIKEAMKTLNISEQEIVFDLNKPIELFVRLSKLDSEGVKKLKSLSKAIKKKRDWKRLGEEYLKVLRS